MSGPFEYCGYCGSSLLAQGSTLRPDGSRQCTRCGGFVPDVSPQRGPALLVLVALFAEDRVLLQRRGLPPYPGKWAPPGGFVEHGESLETAAVREVREEVGIELEPAQLIPCAVISLPRLNQVYHGFLVRLPTRLAARAAPPESLEVGWFTEAECRQIDSWDPAASIDIGIQFEFFRVRAFGFIQNTDAFLRIIRGETLRYL